MSTVLGAFLFAVYVGFVFYPAIKTHWKKKPSAPETRADSCFVTWCNGCGEKHQNIYSSCKCGSEVFVQFRRQVD